MTTPEKLREEFQEKYAKFICSCGFTNDECPRVKEIIDYWLQKISDQKAELRKVVDTFTVYYRSKFSQDCSRGETNEEKNTEMVELSDILKVLE